MISAILSFGLGMFKYTLMAGGVLAAAAAWFKPDEESGKRYIKQFRGRNAVQGAIENSFNLNKLVFQDMILFRVAQDEEGTYIGAFGAWFPTK